MGADHRIDRIQRVLSSRPNWDYPTPSHAGECVPHSLGVGEGVAHSLAGEGGGGPNSNEGTDRHCGILQ